MKNKKDLWRSITFFASFILWTIFISFVDVQPIGPRGSDVGFATINGLFHDLTGVHMTLYHITDWLGLVPVAFGFGFAILGLIQWIKRKHILKVDYSILVLGGYYVVVLAAYLFFEEYVVNYRPVLIAGYLEACPLVETVNYYGETSGVLESPINNVAYQWAFPDEMDFAGFASGYDIIVKGTYDGYVADRKEYGFIFTINDVLSGYEEYVVPGKEIVLYVPNGRLLSKELEAGKEYIVRGHYSTIVDTTYRPGKLEKHGKKYSDYSVLK